MESSNWSGGAGSSGTEDRIFVSFDSVCRWIFLRVSPLNDLLTGNEPIPTIDDLIRCAEREIKMRKKVYPWRVRQGKMPQGQADREIRLMEAILENLLHQKA